MPDDNIRHSTAGMHDASGRFAKGNPGRPKGAKGRQSRQVLEQVKSFGPNAIQALWEAVNLKERWAVEFVLSSL